ncbi:MAG: nucleotidyltransferase family protein [Candidatus Sericytochromatia bacterium]
MNKNKELDKILLELLSNNTNKLDLVLKNLDYDSYLYLLEKSKKQNITQIIYYKLMKNNFLNYFPKEISNTFENYFKKETFKNLKIKAEILKIVKEFNKNNIPMIILKGSHLNFFIYENIALRHSRDIDILVPKNKLKEAYLILKNIGYDSKKIINISDFENNDNYHLPELINNNIVLEVHEHIYNIEYKINIPINDLWNNLSKNYIDNLEVLIFDEVYLLIHLIVHIVYEDHFAMDLRHYYDIYVLLDKFKNKINFDRFVLISKNYNIEKGVFIVLKVIEKIFEFNFPLDFFSRLSNNFEFDYNLIDNAIEIMNGYDKTDLDYYVKYKDMHNTFNNFFDKNKTHKIIKIIKRIFITKKEFYKKYKININFINAPYYYSKRFFYLLNRNSFLISNNNKKTQDFLELVKKSDIINNWKYE